MFIYSLTIVTTSEKNRNNFHLFKNVKVDIVEMTSIMSHGKYRQRTNSIPTLFSLEEESIPGSETHNGIPPKPPRRSSLAINLLGNRGPNPEKHNKRRSSIAVAFLGRHNKVI